MTDKINDGGAAFPYSDSQVGFQKGVTKREYFAGIALQGLLSGRYFGEKDKPKKAYEMADAMIKEGEK